MTLISCSLATRLLFLGGPCVIVVLEDLREEGFIHDFMEDSPVSEPLSVLKSSCTLS